MATKATTLQHHIIFDIDSTSIGALVFQRGLDIDGIPVSRRELFSTRKNITHGKPYPFEKFFKRTLEVFRSVAEETQYHALVPIDTISINVSTPWTSAQQKIISYKKRKPFIYNQSLADELIQKDYKSQNNKKDIASISTQIIDVYGNGYPLLKPEGKEMIDLEIHVLKSVISKYTKGEFSSVIESVFHREPQFTSNSFINYQAVKTLLPHTNSSVIIDMSGEVTEVLVVVDDHLRHIGSIPVGTHHMIRSLSEELKIPIEKAHSLVRMYTKGHIEDSYQESLKPAMKKSFRMWFRDFYNLIDVYAQEGIIPSTLVFKTNNEMMSWIQEYILSEDTLQEHMHARQAIEMIILGEVYKDSDTFTDMELGIISDVIFT